MRRLLLLSMIPVMMLWQSCATGLTQIRDDIATVAAKTRAGLEKAEKGYEALESKVAAVDAQLTKTNDSVEAIVGPMDRDGDGDVTAKEAATTINELRKTPEGRSLLADPEFWLLVGGSISGLWVGKKGIVAAWAAQHRATRRIVNTGTGGSGPPS